MSIDLSAFGMFDLHSYSAIPVFFDAGREVHSNFSDAMDHYERRRDLTRHLKILANYTHLNPSATLDAKVYLRCEPDSSRQRAVQDTTRGRRYYDRS